jgi:hypothetical protein
MSAGGAHLRALVALVALGLAAGAGAQSPPPTSSEQQWWTFEGGWSATGTRLTLPTGAERPATLVHLSGAVVLVAGPALSRGFRGEAIYYDDGQGIGTGRAVWTDQHGDQIFSEIKGEPVISRKRITGTITGGTGRYAGVVGDYSLVWRFVVEVEPGVLEGMGVNLKGRIRRAEATR